MSITELLGHDTSPSARPSLVVRGPGDVGLEQRGATAPGPCEVRVEPRHVGLCGTDLEIIDGTLDPEYVTYPLVIGHEWSGLVAEVGPDVQGLRVGDPVVVEGIVPDGVCAECRSGRTNLCEHYDELGFTRDGAAGSNVTVPQHLVHRLDPTVALEAGALIEPSAVVLRGLSELGIERGSSVLVIGDGTVALLAAHVVRLWAPSAVMVSGRREAQRTLAESMGADRFITDSVPVRSFDVVIEAAGSAQAVEVALGAARRGGKVLLLGIAGHGKTVVISSDDLVNNDLLVRGSFGYTATSWRQATALLNTGQLKPLPLITHRFALGEHTAALDALRSPDTDRPRGKVLLDLTAPR